MCLMFALLDCLFSKETYNRIKSISIVLKVKRNFSLQSLNFRKIQMGHLHTCPLHLNLMPIASLLHILHNEETRDKTFDYIFHSQLKKIAPKLFRLFDLKFYPIGCDLPCPHTHHYWPLPFSLSLQKKKKKPIVQIMNNWWLKYKLFLISLKYS